MSMSDAALLIVVSTYVALSLALFGFGMNLLAFSFRVWRRSGALPTPAPLADRDLPVVTVQIPIYNELYVSRRIIEAVCAFDYPRDRLEIQVLDDSTDETSVIIAGTVAEARGVGIDISHIRRTDRTGYKAGALAAGMETARGTYIAIFDADFVPDPDFLRRALPHFDEPNVAFVQARWGHVNRDFSWLTRLQAIAIDGHFLVEQAARGRAGYWFNFNGTAGVWSAAAIAGAGGWKADTLTEDLDLSYRAHLAGWTARFVEDLVVPAEVPAQLGGFRRQQHRWARGSLECAVGLLPMVWRSNVRLSVRAQATFHLTAYMIQLLLLALLLLYPFVVLAGQRFPGVSTIFGIGYLVAWTSIAPTVFFVTGSVRNGRRVVRDLPYILMITAFGAGLVVNTARAALQIVTRPNPSFERTAKFGLVQADKEQTWATKRYQLAPDRIVLVEIALAAYAAMSAVLALVNDNYGIFVYACVFFVGLSGVATATIAHNVTLYRHRERRDSAIAAESVCAEVTSSDVTTPDVAAHRAVVVMAKQPVPGRTKTRLSPRLTAGEAADLYECLLMDTITNLRRRGDCTLLIAIDEPASKPWFDRVAPGVGQLVQRGPSLGHRLDAVMSDAFEQGFDEVFALGSDSPDLPSAHLDDAFAALGGTDVDVVLGPALDGGYYLIGVTRPPGPVVTDVQMSTPTVLDDTLAVAAGLGLRVHLAPTWHDVDTPADIQHLARASSDRLPATWPMLERLGPQFTASTS